MGNLHQIPLKCGFCRGQRWTWRSSEKAAHVFQKTSPSCGCYLLLPSRAYSKYPKGIKLTQWLNNASDPPNESTLGWAVFAKSSGDPCAHKERKRPSRSRSRPSWNCCRSSRWLQERGSKGCRAESQGQRSLKELRRHEDEAYCPLSHSESGEITQPRWVSATAPGACIAALAAMHDAATQVPAPALTAALLSSPAPKNPKSQMFKRQKLMPSSGFSYRIRPVPVYLRYYLLKEKEIWPKHAATKPSSCYILFPPSSKHTVIRVRYLL